MGWSTLRTASFARRDSAVSFALSVTSRSFVPHIFTVMLASFLTKRCTTALCVRPSSDTVCESSSALPACTMDKSLEDSVPARSLNPSDSSASAPETSVLRSATVCFSSNGSQYSRSVISPVSDTSTAALMQMN